MVSEVQHLTRLTDALRPRVCQGCSWWQQAARAREIDRARWIDEFEERYGSWGKLYLDGDRHVGSLQYGPAQAFPRGASMPAGPPSDDAVLVTCSYLSDPSSPWALQSLFLACLGESKDRGAPAVEAFAYVYEQREDFGTRFLEHRTIFPRDFLADLGFRTLRVDGRVELMRLELGGLLVVPAEGIVAELVRRAREALARPEPARL
jgi:hypothetical protein